jgi:hypothetical protein
MADPSRQPAPDEDAPSPRATDREQTRAREDRSEPSHEPLDDVSVGPLTSEDDTKGG